MNTKEFYSQLKLIEKEKLIKNFENYNLTQLHALPVLNGIIKLKFNKYFFYMININNDDGVVLKYLWRNHYEPFSLKLWYKITREDKYYIDIGAHTGIYSIIGNLNKNQNQIISIEPYFLNYARLISNLRLNNISHKYCSLSAMSNCEGQDTFLIKTDSYYLSQGGKITEGGNFKVIKRMLDNFKFNKKIGGIKIDTEGHEFETIQGSLNTIQQFLPDIIFEINKVSFNNCLEILKPYKYKFYLIDEKNKKLKKINKFNDDYMHNEGINCLATKKM